MTAPAWTSTFGDVGIQGDSTQNVIGTTVNGVLIQKTNTFVRGRPSMYLGSETVADLLDGYVRAGNHDLIVSALQTDHAVVLTGPRGCGRETTAIAAIRQLNPGIRLRRFSLEDEDTEEIRTEDAGHLVHAADGGLSRLESCVEAVRAAGGYLVVIADAGGPPVSAFLRSIPVEPPDPLKVYRHRMNRRGLTDGWHWDVAPTLLEGASPGDARRLADITERIARRGGGGLAQRAEVINAYRRWEDQLRGWFTAHGRPDERALLVAAAALSPAEDADVYTVASSLARRLDIRMNGAGLVWCPASGLRELLEVGAEEERIVFRRYGFAEAASDTPWRTIPWPASTCSPGWRPCPRRMPFSTGYANRWPRNSRTWRPSRGRPTSSSRRRARGARTAARTWRSSPCPVAACILGPEAGYAGRCTTGPARPVHRRR